MILLLIFGLYRNSDAPHVKLICLALCESLQKYDSVNKPTIFPWNTTCYDRHNAFISSDIPTCSGLNVRLRSRVHLYVPIPIIHIYFLYSVALVRKRTIPTERPPLVDEVNANFSAYRVLRGQRDESRRPL
jgi:hypothetical protein